MEKPTRARRRKLETAKADLEPPLVIDGSDPRDAPVGQRWGMVEPALWRRRRMVPPHRTTVCAGDTVGKRRGGARETWYRPSGRYGRERATPTDERVGNRERKHRPEATRRSVWIEAEAKFQLMRCQESERGVLLMNEA
jgi:hypothetical protein